MATAGAVFKLRPIEVSPTTLQYNFPKKSAKARPAYPKRFYPSHDAKATLALDWLQQTDPNMPPYPYGRNNTFEEANFGLYGGLSIQSGNKISDGRNKGRTKRKWYPNVRVEKLRSEALGVELNLPVVARVSRTIRKCGGLDQYLLGEKPARLKELGLLGWKLRWLVAKSDVVQTRWAEQRKELGLEPKQSLEAEESTSSEETFAQAWKDPNVRRELIEKMSVGWEQLKAKDKKFLDHVKKTMQGRGDLEEKGKKSEPIKVLQLFNPEDLSSVENVEEEKSRIVLRLPHRTKNELLVAAHVSGIDDDTAVTQSVSQLQAILDNTPREVIEETLREEEAEKPADA